MAFDVVRTGAVNRAESVHVEPSGKGVNVSRALTANGVAARAVLPIGGAEGRQLAELLDAEGVDYLAVPVRHPVRVNLSVATADGVVTKLNEQGPVLDAAEVGAVVAAVAHCAVGAAWIVGSGTLAPGMSTDFYVRLAEVARAVGARFALDTSGPPLRAGVAAGPELLKPNREELAELVGSPLRTMGDVVAAAGKVRVETGGTVVVTLGPDGAVAADEDGVSYGEAPAGRVRSAVGAGDNFLAGYLTAACGGRIRALREALAWGAAAVRAPGSLASPVVDADRAAVRVETTIDLDRQLR